MKGGSHSTAGNRAGDRAGHWASGAPTAHSEAPTLGLTVRPLLLFRAPSTLGAGTTAARCASAAERLGMLQAAGRCPILL